MSNYTSENLIPGAGAAGTPAIRIGDHVFPMVVSGGVDVSDTTATPETVLSGAIFRDSTGAEKTGTIPTVSATLNANVVTVPRGFIASQTEITVGSAVSGGTITPTSSAIVISSGGFLLSDLTIAPVSSSGSGGGSSTGSGGSAGSSGSASGSPSGFYCCVDVQDTLGYTLSGFGVMSSFTGLYVDSGTSDGTRTYIQTSGGSMMPNGARIYTSGGDLWITDGAGSRITHENPERYLWNGNSIISAFDWNNWQWLDGSASSIPTPLDSGWWKGFPLVQSGGYMTVDSSGSPVTLGFTRIVPESGTVYSPDALVVVKDFWNGEYGLVVKALTSGIIDDKGSYTRHEEFDTEPDEDGFFWGGSEYSMIEYMTPGGGDGYEGEGGDGEPWNATIRHATVEFDFRYSDAPDEGSSTTIYHHSAGEHEWLNLLMDSAGVLTLNGVNLGHWAWVDDSVPALLADTIYSIAFVFDLDYYYFFIDGTLRARRKAMDPSYNSGISSISLRDYEVSGTFGYKNLRVWNRARRDLIPGYTPTGFRITSSGVEGGNVSSGGVEVSSGGNVSSGGSSSDGNVSSGGEVVSSGGEVVSSGGVSSGGEGGEVDYPVTLESGGIMVSQGVSMNGVDVNSGYSLFVRSGGNVASAIVKPGGMLTVDGGTVYNVHVNSEGTMNMILGTGSLVTIEDDAMLTVYEGGYMNEVIRSDEGYICVSSGARVDHLLGGATYAEAGAIITEWEE